MRSGTFGRRTERLALIRPYIDQAVGGQANVAVFLRNEARDVTRATRHAHHSARPRGGRRQPTGRGGPPSARLWRTPAAGRGLDGKASGGPHAPADRTGS